MISCALLLLFAVPPPPDLTFVDPGTDERITVTASGQVTYRGKAGAPEQKLTVEGEVKSGAFKVRFKNDKRPYAISIAADHKSLVSTGPDGVEQHFEEALPKGAELWVNPNDGLAIFLAGERAWVAPQWNLPKREIAVTGKTQEKKFTLELEPGKPESAERSKDGAFLTVTDPQGRNFRLVRGDR